MISAVEIARWPNPMLWERAWGKYYYMSGYRGGPEGSLSDDIIQSPSFGSLNDCLAWGQGLSTFQQNIVEIVQETTLDNLAWTVERDPNAWAYRVQHPQYECLVGLAGFSGKPLYLRNAQSNNLSRDRELRN